MDSSQPGWIQFGSCRLSLAEGRLQRDGIERELSLGEVAALTLLLAEPGELVERNTLLEHLMAKGEADEDALDLLMDALRRALGDSLLSPRVIQRVGRKGYRWIAGEPDPQLDSAAEVADDEREPIAPEDARDSESDLAAEPDDVLADAEFSPRSPHGRRPRRAARFDAPATGPAPDFLSRVRARGARVLAPPAPGAVILMFAVVLGIFWFSQADDSPYANTGLPGYYQARTLDLGTAPSLGSALSPDGRLLVQAQFEGGQSDLQALDLLSLARTPITGSASLETEPALAIGNRMLAFTRRQNALATPVLWLRDLDTGDESQLRRLARGASFAPTGDAVAYVAEDGKGGRTWVEIIEFSDGTARALPGTDGALAVDWSLSGWELAVLGEQGIQIIKLPDGQPELIRRQQGELLDVAWDLDSRHLLVAVRTAHGSALQRMAASTDAPLQTLWQGAAAVRALSTAGTRAIALSTQHDRRVLRGGEAGADTTFKVPDDVDQIALSADGKRLLLRIGLEGAGPARLVQLDWGKDKPGVLFESEDCGHGAQYAPDGSEIAFVCLRGEHAGLWRMRLSDGQRIRVATPFYPTGRSRPAYSPDGLMLVHADAILNGSPGIWLIPLERGLPRRLSSKRATSVAFSPDGRMVAACVIANATRELWLFGVRGDTGRRLATRCSERAAPVWAEDSRSLRVLLSERAEPSIVSLALDGQPIGEPQSTAALAADSLGVEDWVESAGRQLLLETRTRSELVLLEPGEG